MSGYEKLLGASVKLVEACNADPELAVLLPSKPVTIGITGDPPHTRGIAIRLSSDGAQIAPIGVADFSMSAPDESWDECLSAQPRPNYHHFLAMLMRIRGAEILGSQVSFAQHAHLARRLVELSREAVTGLEQPEPGSAIPRAGIRGSYVEIPFDGSTVNVFVEAAGDSRLPTILVLHTAGADTRQAHALMTDSELLNTHRIVTFDLPGHGKSDTLKEPIGRWTLTHDRYIDAIVGVIDALGLNHPILLGASMAGEACLAAALNCPGQLGGVIACEAAEFVPGRATSWPRDTRVNATLFTPEWIDGLIGPAAPSRRRAEIKWQYSQSGYGVFSGDIDFYSGGWDARGRLGGIDTRVCPVVMMTGEYDYSCTPEMSAATSAQILGSVFWEMPGLGHFPLAENPTRFAPHLRRALSEIERQHRV